MPEPLETRVPAIWQHLAQQNRWQLVEHPEPLVRQAIQELGATEAVSDRIIRMALTRIYSRHLHAGLEAQVERAAQELWLACARLAQRRGLPQDQAAAAAQETIRRVLERLPTLRDPGALIAYALRVLQTVLPAQAERPGESLEQGLLAGLLDEPIAASATATDVEQRLIDEQIRQLILAKLPNELERQVLLRWVLWGDKPRDVARALGVPLARARIAKHRALQRLRDDAEFMRFSRSLYDPDER